MMQQRVDQRAAIAGVFSRSRARVHHHAGRLVDDCEVVVFVNDVEMNFFGDGTERRALDLAQDFDLFVAAQAQGSFRRISVYDDLLLRDQRLHASTAGVRKLRDEELIQSCASVFRADNESGRRHRDADYRRSPARIVLVGYCCPPRQRKPLTAENAEKSMESAEKSRVSAESGFSANSLMFSANSAVESFFAAESQCVA